MSDPVAPRAAAIRCIDLSKSYHLYRGPGEEMLDAVGFLRLMPWRKPVPLHPALRGVSLTIGHGERVGIIGRNGAGKSTLLKLVTGAAAPSAGVLLVDGTVQSLSSLGIGFHPEFSGIENIKSALVYNSLSEGALAAAIEDIVEFCELDRFMDMPIRSYSAGMLARLYFATATAIRPDILVVDEVLGAGDAYFAARSAARMRQLALSGCTLLLVSHSNQQVLEFCERCIWIERGRVVADGSTLSVIKAYEAFIQHLAHAQGGGDDVIHNERIVDDALLTALQESPVASTQADVQADGGISAWPASRRVRISDAWFEDAQGAPSRIGVHGSDWTIAIRVRIEQEGSYRFRPAHVLFGPDGRWSTRLIGPPTTLEGPVGTEREVRCRFSPMRLGPADYVLSVSLHGANEPWDIGTAERFDLLSRSFAFTVKPRSGQRPGKALPVRHDAEWARI